MRGTATGARELGTLSPSHLVPSIDALLLTGGSAFGLAAADGVVEWLEDAGRGFDTGVARVPIVPAAVIFDLEVGDPGRRPDAAMGRLACEAAGSGALEEGRVGAGTGATVGKWAGADAVEPGGLGTWAGTTRGDHTIGALAVVNAFGSVVDGRGRVLAGAGGSGRGPDREPATPPTAGTNTTLAVVATDAPLTRVGLQHLARAASTAVARRTAPAHTVFDGDVTFALSTADDAQVQPPEVLLEFTTAAVGALEHAVERAVHRA